ncbi:hypothetical protein [Fimbriiglobus ruber]|uniref:Uncharacterized protein n=1 Tax=Fimbriiglobus ruber TaxID=1908690 RepID=A0A225D3S4_9BACT|nr:hypothetical protein [Fimbriiglobus ruber]OWK34284.1 hypothetical protein FRUB_10255 [Fimbriiglobus ruber]
MPDPELTLDERVKKVADFMEQTITAHDRIGVALALAEIAPVVWAKHGGAKIEPLTFRHRSIQGFQRGIGAGSI